MARTEAIVVLGVARQHPFAVVEHVVEDRAADRHRADVGRAPVAAGLRLQLPGVGIEEHDTPAVGLDPLEHELEDPAEKLVDVERVADGKRRAVHHLEIAAGPGEPAVVGVAGSAAGRAVEDVVLERRDDSRPLLGDRGKDLDLIAGGVGGGVAGIGEDRPADEDLVAVMELCPFHPPAVNERAVGAFEVADDVAVADLADLGMPPRDLVVFELDDVARLAADAHGPLAGSEIEPGAAVAALNDKQRRHGGGAREGGAVGRKRPRRLPRFWHTAAEAGSGQESLRGWGERRGEMRIQFSPRGPFRGVRRHAWAWPVRRKAAAWPGSSLESVPWRAVPCRRLRVCLEGECSECCRTRGRSPS